eukprot:scaffold350438_cov51-Prasinocladus_malaysianus.AAC.1
MTLMGPGKILPPLIGSMVAAYVCYAGVDKVFGNPVPPTVSDPAWYKATAERYDSWERSDSGAPPVALNPIRRGVNP